MNFKTLLIKIFITHPGVFVPGCNFYKSHSLKNHNKGFSFSPAYREWNHGNQTSKARHGWGQRGSVTANFLYIVILKASLFEFLTP